MVSSKTVNMMQTTIATTAILANAVLHTIGFSALGKTTSTDPAVASAKKTLMISFIIQYIAVAMMIGSTAFIIIKPNSPMVNGIAYGSIFVSTGILFFGSILAINTAMKLQCLKTNYPHIETAWKMATISSVIGIIGVLLILLVQAYVHREKIQTRALQYLGPKVSQPTPQYDVSKINQVFGVKPVAEPVVSASMRHGRNVYNSLDY